MYDGELIAIAIGTKSKTTITQGKRCLIFKKIQKGKKVSRKRVLEITEKQVKNYKSMGKAEGLNLFHCLYLARKYTENFNDRVVAYMIIKPTQEVFRFAVAFYEKKKDSQPIKKRG